MFGFATVPIVFSVVTALSPCATRKLISMVPATARTWTVAVDSASTSTPAPDVTFESLIFARTVLPMSFVATAIPIATETDPIAPEIETANAPAKAPISDVSRALTLTS